MWSEAAWGGQFCVCDVIYSRSSLRLFTFCRGPAGPPSGGDRLVAHTCSRTADPSPIYLAHCPPCSFLALSRLYAPRHRLLGIMSRPISSSASSATIDLEASSHKDLPRRPWRPNVTPLNALLAEEWEGEGTEARPYIVSWMTKDVENPQTWTTKYKWIVTALVSSRALLSIFSG